MTPISYVQLYFALCSLLGAQQTDALLDRHNTLVAAIDTRRTAPVADA